MVDYIPHSTLKLIQDKRYKMSSDTIHLAQFLRLRKNDKIIDVGTNNGVLALYASIYTKNQVMGIDISTSAIECAQTNALLNEIKNISFYVSQLQDFNHTLVDVIICNPPYHKAINNSDEMQFDHFLSLEDLAKHSYRLLKDKGRCMMIIKAYRMIETIQIFHDYQFALRRIQMVHHSLSHQASSVCFEFVKEGKEHCLIEAPIINVVESQ